MSAPFSLYRNAVLAGLLTLVAPALTQAQTRDAGSRDAGSTRDAGTRDAGRGTSSGEDSADADDDGVYYPGGDDSTDDAESASAVKAGGGGVSCTLGEGAGPSGGLLLLGLLAVRGRRRRR